MTQRTARGANLAADPMRLIWAGMTLACFTIASACGNLVGDIQSAGLTGVAVDAAGSVTIVSYVCAEGVTDVTVYRDRAGLKESAPNEVVATFSSTSDLSGFVTLDIANPGPGWTPATPLVLEGGKGYLISAGGTEDESSETGQVYVMTDQLGALVPGPVYTTDVGSDTPQLEPQSKKAFIQKAKGACAS